MKYIIFSLILFLSGCAVKPLAPKWPDAPEELKKRCESLKTIEGNEVSLSDMLKIVVKNYTLHYECSIKVEGWNEWYENQKKIYETVVPEEKSLWSRYIFWK